MTVAQTVGALEDLARRAMAGPRFLATLSNTFSVTTMLLAALGVFGLVAYAVSQRRREFGIRAVLGASPMALGFAAVLPPMNLIGIGVASGLVGAACLSRFVEKAPFGVEPVDIPAISGVAALMLLVGAAAAAIPARCVMRSDPMSALKSE